ANPKVARGGNFAASITDGNSHTATHQLDDHGRLLTLTLPSTATQSFTRNSVGLPLTQTDLNGNTTSRTYDSSSHNVATEVGPDHLTVSYLYGNSTTVIANDPTSMVDGKGRTTLYDYDSSGELTATIQPDGTTLHNTYSGGLLASTVDALGHTTSYQHDSHRRVTGVVDALGNTTTYAYDLVNGTVTTVDPSGVTTVATYNKIG